MIMSTPGTYRLPDDRVIEISPSDFRVSEYWFGGLQFHGRLVEGGFQFGPTGTVENMMTMAASAARTEVGAAQSGSVSILEGVDFPGSGETLAVPFWTGPYHEIYAPHLDLDRFSDWLEMFDLRDAEDGIVLAPRSSRVRIENLHVQVDIDDLGTLEIRPITASSISAVPRWTGTSVSGGELFSHRFHEDDDGVYVLVTASAVCTVYPTDGRPLTHQARLDALERLLVAID